MTDLSGLIDRESLRLRLIGMLAAILIASVGAVGVASIVAFDRAVQPELASRTRLIGSIVRGEVQRAIELGIPFASIVGLDRYLSQTLERFEEVDRIVVATVLGQTIASVERPTAPLILGPNSVGETIAFRETTFELPIVDGNRLVGKITVEINPLFVQTRLRNVFLDVLVIALVATLVAMELVLAVAVNSVGKPLERLFRLLVEQSQGNFLHRIRTGGLGSLGRTSRRLNDRAEDLAERLAELPTALRARIGSMVQIADARPQRLRVSDLNDIRLALFLFSVASEVAAAFLPLYAREASRPEWISSEIAAAAPLVVYLVVVALAAPFGGELARRVGARRLFVASVPPTVLALVAIGFSDSLITISLWRGVMAFSYGMATIACQEYAIRSAQGGGSSRPIGTFVAVVYAGVFCGSALGGVVAGRFGFETAFFMGALVAVFSGGLGAFAMRGKAGDSIASELAPSGEVGRKRWQSPQFLALLLGVAAPMNAAAAIVVWYLTPLMLAALGLGPADIARVVMIYYLAVVLVGPIATAMSDGRVGPLVTVVCGAVASGASLLSLSLWGGFWAILAAVAGLGVAHTLMRAPIYALTQRLTGSSNAGLGVLRLVERVGAIVGLTFSAWLLRDVGAERLIQAVGVAVLIGIVAYGISEIAERAHPA